MARPTLSSLEPSGSSRSSRPSRLYHAAPVAVRDSVLEHGLDPARFPRERWDASDLGVWCFETFERAADYAKARASGPLAEAYEVWEVTVEELDMTRPWYDPELSSGVDVWWLREAVPAERVRPAAGPEPASLEL